MYGIESANIVGYTSTELPADGLSIGAAFIPVSGTKIDLVDLKVVGYEDETWGDVQVQTLTGSGGTDKTYLWYDGNDGETDWYGWYDDETYEPLKRGDVQIAPGEGLWSVSFENFSIQSAGQVPMADVALTLPADGLTIANPTPVAVDLVDCYVDGYEDETWGDVQVQTLTGSGGTDKTYLWYDGNDGETDWYGWYDDETYEPLERGTVVVEPGAGLWSVSFEEFNFVWPKVTITK